MLLGNDCEISNYTTAVYRNRGIASFEVHGEMSYAVIEELVVDLVS
jgi:hypothetical protein